MAVTECLTASFSPFSLFIISPSASAPQVLTFLSFLFSARVNTFMLPNCIEEIQEEQ